MDDNSNDQGFKEQLDDHYEWPAKYLFKFIVPYQKVDEIIRVFPEDQPVIQRASSGGKYVSISADVMMKSSEEVMTIYRNAYLVDGVISL